LQGDEREAIRDLIRGYEKGADPFRFKSAGWCAWPIYRFRIALRLLAHTGGDRYREPSEETTPGIPSTMKELAGALPYQLFGLWRASRGHTLVLGKSGQGWRRDLVGERMYDMSFDFLEEALDGFTLSESCTSRQRGNPYPSIFDEYAYPYRFVSQMRHWRLGTTLEDELLADFSGWLRKSEFAASYGVPAVLTRRGLVTRFLADMHYWRLIFKVIRPRLFLLVCSYGQEAPVAAARSLGIPVWELQHGMISEYHFGYSYGEEARTHADALPLPERIITFGRFFSDALLSCGYWTEAQVPPLGFPRLAHFKGEYQRKRRGELTVLVSTQWTLEDEYFDFISRSLELFPEGVKLIAKPHPRSLPRSISRLETLSSERFEVVDRSVSFYDSVMGVDIHCAAYSTTLLETVGLGLPTVIMGLPGWENVAVLQEKGAAELVKSPQDLAELVRKSLEIPGFYDDWRSRSGDSEGYFFEPYHVESARAMFSQAY